MVLNCCWYGIGATQWDEPKGGQALTGPFVPSATFTGAAVGYVFKMGPKGLGYYQDTASGMASFQPFQCSSDAYLRVSSESHIC